MCCSVLQCVAMRCPLTPLLNNYAHIKGVLQCVLQYVLRCVTEGAVCCSVCCSVLPVAAVA